MPELPEWTLFDAALRGVLLALLVLLAALLRRDRPRAHAALAATALCAGLCVQVVSSTPLFEATVPRAWQAPWVGISVGNAVLFWVFVRSLFDDEFAWRAHHSAAWLAAVVLGASNCALGPDRAWAAPAHALQRALPLVFALLAARSAAAHWRADLVEGRRRLRVFILVTGVGYTLVMLALRLGSAQARLSPQAALWDNAMLLAILSVVACKLLRLGESDLFPSPQPPGTQPSVVPQRAPTGPPVTDAIDDRLADALQRLMAEERFYRSEDLSLARLAARLAVPEYRLRRLINQRLGFRNFNAFVNAWRLDDSRAALADPQRRALPVLTIALDAGFQSIGPFNRAFKAATGLTPTEFRRQKLADS